MKKVNLAIFASGSGSNAENIISYFKNNDKVDIKIVISNKPDAYVHERVKKEGVPSLYVKSGDMKDGEKICGIVHEYDIDFIVLSGFLLQVPEKLINEYPGKIVNIHPALLPKFGGKGMYGSRVHEAVLASGEKKSGITIHLIDKDIDKGTNVAQFECPVLKEDTPETLAARVHELEYMYFPSVIEDILKKEFV